MTQLTPAASTDLRVIIHTPVSGPAIPTLPHPPRDNPVAWVRHHWKGDFHAVDLKKNLLARKDLSPAASQELQSPRCCRAWTYLGRLLRAWEVQAKSAFNERKGEVFAYGGEGRGRHGTSREVRELQRKDSSGGPHLDLERVLQEVQHGAAVPRQQCRASSDGEAREALAICRHPRCSASLISRR